MSHQIAVSTLEVRKDSWGESRVVTEEIDPKLADNDVLFRVDRLALTSNNISYAASGEALGYWGFFPAEAGWGRIPAMGWADVIASAHPGIEVGERVWGFFPISTHLKIQAGNVGNGQFSDVSPHRADYAPVYAQFDRAKASPIYDPAREDQDSLLRGLFTTSWLVEDFLHVNGSFGAETCLITSASSKTSIALGYCVQHRGELTAIGITSAGNVDFCNSVGCYERVITYDHVDALDAAQAVVLVDMAGSAGILTALHGHFEDNMKHSCRIGMTHYKEMAPVADLPGAKPEFFFAPTHIVARSAEVGAKDFMMRMGKAYAGFRPYCDGWLSAERHHGPEAVVRAYQTVLTGKADPAVGQVVSMWPQSAGQ